MSNLCEKNSLRTRDFKLGEQEAELFISEDYLSLHQSTLAKVGAFSDIAELAHTNKLKTNTGWLEYNAPSFVALIDYLREHPIFIVLSLMLNLFLTVIAISGYLANG